MERLSEVNSMEEFLCIKASEARVPISATFELTPICNLSCDMCYIRLNQSEVSKCGRIRSATEWLEIAKELKELGCMFLLLTGGEPLLYPEFPFLYEELRKLGFILTINSNGTLLQEEMVKVLAKNKPRRMNITLYGASNETYERVCHTTKGLDRVVEGIHLLKQNGIAVKLNGTITPNNIGEEEALLAIAQKLEVPISVDTYMFPFVRANGKPYCEAARLPARQAAEVQLKIMKQQCSAKEWEQYVEEGKSRLQRARLEDAKEKEQSTASGLRCRAGRSSLWITWNWEMLPCFALEHAPVTVTTGNVREAWEQVVKLCEQIPSAEKCEACDRRTICEQCPGRRLAETSSIQETGSYLCEYTDTIYKRLG